MMNECHRETRQEGEEPASKQKIILAVEDSGVT